MIVEINAASDFLIHLITLPRRTPVPVSLSEYQLEMFKRSLSNLLRNRYREHWFPEYPNKGSGYRCIRINQKMDPIISQAGSAMGIPADLLRYLFPHELTLWIDPEEVSYRIGENGSICVLYESEKNQSMINAPPPRQSPELYHDPKQYEQIDPHVDYVEFNC